MSQEATPREERAATPVEVPDTDVAQAAGAESPGADLAHAAEPEPEPEAAADAAGGRQDEPDLDVTQIAAAAAAHRAPRYGRWILVGILVGAVAAAVPTVLGPPGVILGRGTIFLLLFLGLGMAGALLGALAALVVERRTAPPPAAARPRRARARG